jgi:hypothetical protein
MIYKFLLKDEKNVVVVHCLAGKGRTGTAICCFLLFCCRFKNSQDALLYYALKRSTFNKDLRSKGSALHSLDKYDTCNILNRFLITHLYILLWRNCKKLLLKLFRILTLALVANPIIKFIRSNKTVKTY